MIISVFGVKVKISPLFFPGLTVMFLADKTGLALPVTGAMLVHEAGHIIAMKIVGQRLKEVDFIPSAILIKGEPFWSVAGDIFVVLGGIIANTITAVTFCFINDKYVYFVAANLCIAIINAVPVKGLDGGKFLEIIIQKYILKWYVVSRIISIVIGIVFILASVVFVLHGRISPTALIFGLYILIVSLIKV